MKNIVLVTTLILSFILGGFSVGIFYENKVANITEDIISEEVRLLSLAVNASIPCDKLLKSGGWIYDEYTGYSVFWKLYADQSMVAKLVVGEEYSSAVETFENSCPRE